VVGPVAESGSFTTRESVLKASGWVAVIGDDTGSEKASLVDDSAPPLDSLSLREVENHDANQLISKGGKWYLERRGCGRNRGSVAWLCYR
jgi:hypothetical protein